MVQKWNEFNRTKNCKRAQYRLEGKNDMNEIQTIYNSHQRKVN